MLTGAVPRHRPSVVAVRALVLAAVVLAFIGLCTLDMHMRINGVIAQNGPDATFTIGNVSRYDLPDSGQLLQTSRKLSYHEDDFLMDWNEDNDDLSHGMQVPVQKKLFQNSADESYDKPRTASSLTKRLPQAIIIGVKKGGTRALLEILRLHPDVRAPGPEPHFFDRHFHKGIKWYRKQMPLSAVGQITIEKTPSYFVTAEVPARVYGALGNNVRLLVVVRDPVTRAVSDYTQASSKRPMDTRTFEEMAFLNFSTGLVDTNWSAIKIGVYAKHLQKWLSYFPLSQFHFVSGERLISDPVIELDAVQKFLGLRPLIRDHHFFFNQTKGFPCLRRTPHSTVPHCLGKTKGRSHPRIPFSAEQRLRDFYRPFNQKFYRMVERNFEWP